MRLLICAAVGPFVSTCAYQSVNDCKCLMLFSETGSKYKATEITCGAVGHVDAHQIYDPMSSLGGLVERKRDGGGGNETDKPRSACWARCGKMERKRKSEGGKMRKTKNIHTH